MSYIKEVGISFLPDVNHHHIENRARTVGRHPFDVITSYEDLGFPSPMLQLISFAQYSETARFGPACLVVPKYTTMESVVSQISILESLRKNKIFLGLAPGAWLHEVGLRAAKVEQLEEAINSTMYLLNKEVQGFSGQYFTVDPGFKVHYETPATLPIMIGAWGSNMLEMAGANVHVSEVKGGGSANPKMVELLRQRIQKGLIKTQRRNEEVGIVLGAVTVVDRDRKKAMDFAKQRAAMYIDVIGNKDPYAMKEFSDIILRVKILMAEGKVTDAAQIIPDQLARMFVFAGTPEDIIEQSLGIYAAGAKRIEFGSPHGLDEQEGIELLGKEVLPVLHKELGIG